MFSSPSCVLSLPPLFLSRLDAGHRGPSHGDRFLIRATAGENHLNAPRFAQSEEVVFSMLAADGPQSFHLLCGHHLAQAAADDLVPQPQPQTQFADVHGVPIPQQSPEPSREHIRVTRLLSCRPS
jgi:hypothetical protein